MIHGALLVSAIGFSGLLAGPFLSHLIFSVPAQLNQQWQSQAREILELEPLVETSSFDKPSKMFTGMTSLAAGTLAGLVAFKFDISWQTLALVILAWSLLVASAIDHKHKILPDSIILPLIWLGLIVNSFTLFSSLQDAVYGAVGGYLAFWAVGRGFEFITGRSGLGDGDFKLLAVFGAWGGWQALQPIILLASVIGLVAGFIYLRKHKGAEDRSFPFGPSITVAGIGILLLGSPAAMLWLEV